MSGRTFVGVASLLLLGVPPVTAADDGQQSPPLLPIAAILADAELEAPYPVRVRGVVTWQRGRGLIIQHDDAGIWIDAQRSVEIGLWHGDDRLLDEIRPGIEIETVGLADRGGYVPKVLAAEIRVLGDRPQPPPMPIDRNPAGHDRPIRSMTACVPSLGCDSGPWLFDRPRAA